MEEHVPHMGQNSLTPQGKLNSLPPLGNNNLNFWLSCDQGVHLETLKTLGISGKQNSQFPLRSVIKCLLLNCTVSESVALMKCVKYTRNIGKVARFHFFGCLCYTLEMRSRLRMLFGENLQTRCILLSWLWALIALTMEILETCIFIFLVYKSNFMHEDYAFTSCWPVVFSSKKKRNNRNKQITLKCAG